MKTQQLAHIISCRIGRAPNAQTSARTSAQTSTNPGTKIATPTRTASLLAVSLVLTACGSSGGDGNDAAISAQPTGNATVTAPSNQPGGNGTIVGNVIDNGTSPTVSTPGSAPTDDGSDAVTAPVVSTPVVTTPSVTQPVVTETPVESTQPTAPVEPTQPVEVAVPIEPVAPVEPPAPVITSTRVTFDITVPAYSSEELQLDVFWGENELQAGWVVDETWSVSDVLPANSDSELRVVFYDHFGSTTLATYDSTLSTSGQETQTYTIRADEFDSASWDNDNDEVSNLDELRAGTDPDFAEIAGAPTEPPGVTSVQYSGYDLELFWSRGSDEDGVVIGYDIFRDDEQITDRLDALSFYDGSVQPETDYTYDIYSVDNDGLRSRATTVLITTPADDPANGAEANIATLTGGGSSSWFISDGLTTTSGTGPSGSCSYSGGAGTGVGISDARLPNNGDAFDLGSLMWVDGVQVGGWLRSANGSTSNYASVPIANLQINTEFHAISSLPVLRNFTTFSNETTDDIFVVINWASNFGADSGNRIITTSGGDATFGADDRWVITDDGSDGGGDPANTTVFYGPDSPETVAVFTSTSVFNCYGSQGLSARMDVTIPAGETRALMLFHGMSVTQGDARSLATEFNTTPTLSSSLTEGMTEAQLQSVVNWNY